VFNGASGGWTLSTSTAISNNFDITNGTFDTSSGNNYAVTIGNNLTGNAGTWSLEMRNSTWTVSGNWDTSAIATDYSSINSGSSTLIMNGSGTKTIKTGATDTWQRRFFNLQVGASDGQTTQLQSDVGYAGVLTLGTGILDLNSYFLWVTGGYGGAPFEPNPLSLDPSGTFGTGDGVLIFFSSASTTRNMPSFTYDTAVGFQNDTDAPINLTGNATITQYISFGCCSRVTEFNTGGFSLDIGGDVIWGDASAIFTLGTSTVNVTGDWNKSIGGTFNANTSTVIFDGSTTSTLSGSNTFYNLTSVIPNKVLEFATSTGSMIFRVNGALTITGTSGNEVKLQSTSSGTQWFINHQGTENVTYASVLDGGCASTSTNITVQGSINRGNNDFCWLFPTLGFSLDAVSKSLNLNAGNSFTTTATTILTVTSTSEFGYEVTAFQTDNLRNTGVTGLTISDWGGTNAAPTVWTGTCQGASECGWGYNTNDADLSQFAATEYAAFVTSTPGDVVAKSTIAISGDVTTITYRSSVSATQPAGTYQTTIRYIVTPQF